MDINRSFKNNSNVCDENLRRILYTYAVVNPSLDYCQGMNFIAGFLFLFLQDEALSFAVLREIINQFELSTLFNTELPMLKLNFYRLDRLISILLPDLHEHFKDESVNSSYFSSSYFITLFTQMMQYQTTNDNMWKLQRIWDYFIVFGWKAIFKTSILILQEFEESLLDMTFEMMLT